MRFFYDSNGDILARGSDTSTIADAQARIPSVTSYYENDSMLLVKRDDGPYHQIVDGLPVLVQRLTEAQRNEMAVIHRYRPVSRAKASYKEIDFKTGLDASLFPVVTKERGRVTSVVYYGEIEHLTPVVRTDNVFIMDTARNIISRREKTVSWYDEDGQLIPGATKLIVRDWSNAIDLALEASEKRRANVYSEVKVSILGILEMMGLDIETGRAFLRGCSGLFSEWIDHADETNVFAYFDAATDSWLDAPVVLPEHSGTVRSYAKWLMR